MSHIKQHLPTALIVLGGLYAYHNGFLNFLPGFDAPKKSGPFPGK